MSGREEGRPSSDRSRCCGRPLERLARLGGALALGMLAATLGCKSDAPFEACATASGGILVIDDPQSRLNGLRVEFPENATSARVCVTVACGERRLVPARDVPVSCSVQFTPHRRPFAKDLRVTLPLDASLLPVGARGEELVVWRLGRDGRTPYPFMGKNPQADVKERAFTFSIDELTTLQVGVDTAVVAARSAPKTYRAMFGVWGGSQAAFSLGFRNASKFDAVMSLGGHPDWLWWLDFHRRQMFQGRFCKVGDGCRVGIDQLPWPPSREDETHMDFTDKRWLWDYFSPGDFTDLYRGQTRSFGNWISYNPQSVFLAAGVPLSVLDGPKTCPPDATTVPAQLCNAEFNPTGAAASRLFCEDDFSNRHFSEVYASVDVNGDSERSAAEPVLWAGMERWDDVGEDGVPNAAESGPFGAYDPVKNPDPAGDDFHWLHNPSGTENNGLREAGEPFRDYGLDGVPASGMCAADYGEGDGRFSRSPAIERILGREGGDCAPDADCRGYDAARLYGAMTASERARLRVYLGVGMRDGRGGLPSAHWMAGRLSSAGMSLRRYFGHRALMSTPAAVFNENDIDLDRIGRNVLVEYGDATLGTPPSFELDEWTDGTSHGTQPEVVERLSAAIRWTAGVWPSEVRAGGAGIGGNPGEYRFYRSTNTTVCRKKPLGGCYPASSSKRVCAYTSDCPADQECLFGKCLVLPRPARANISCVANSFDSGGGCRANETCFNGRCLVARTYCDPASAAERQGCPTGEECIGDRLCASEGGCGDGQVCRGHVRCERSEGSHRRCGADSECDAGEECSGWRGYAVVKPFGYDEVSEAQMRYPAAYLNFGWSEWGRDNWLEIYSIYLKAWPSQLAGKTPRMLMIMPDTTCPHRDECTSMHWWADAFTLDRPERRQVLRWERSFFEDLVPNVERVYRVKPPEAGATAP